MNEKLKNVIISIVFLIILVGVLIANIIKKDDIVSQSEKRRLEQFPEISYANILNGSFFLILRNIRPINLY